MRSWEVRIFSTYVHIRRNLLPPEFSVHILNLTLLFFTFYFINSGIINIQFRCHFSWLQLFFCLEFCSHHWRICFFYQTFLRVDVQRIFQNNLGRILTRNYLWKIQYKILQYRGSRLSKIKKGMRSTNFSGFPIWYICNLWILE